MEAQSGIFKAREQGWKNGVDSSQRLLHAFPKAYSNIPKMIFGLSLVDCDQDARNRSIAVSVPDITASVFAVQVASFNGCNAHGINCSWMTLPDDLHLEYGSVDTHGTDQVYQDNFRRHIVFGQRFASKPIICVWLQAIDYPGHGDLNLGANDFTSIAVNYENENENSFILSIASWDNRKYRNCRAGWFAYPAEENGKRVKSGRDRVERAQGRLKKRGQFYGQPFERTPATFIAISEMDFSHEKNLRMWGEASAPNNKELEWEYGTWNDSSMNHADITWIAIE
jgi:hypothetical protein